MGITLLAILAFAFAGFLNNIRGLHKHSVASGEREDEPNDQQIEKEALSEVKKSASIKDGIPKNIWLSTIFYWLSCMTIAADALIYTQFNYSLYTEIANGVGGGLSTVFAFLFLILGAVYHGLKNSEKSYSSYILWGACVSSLIIITVQTYRIKGDAQKIDRSGWITHTTCKVQIEEWNKLDSIPLVELGVQAGGQAAFKIKPFKVGISTLEDWKCMIYLDQEQFNEIDYNLLEKGYKLIKNPHFIVVDGRSRVQATWAKMKAMPEKVKK